MRDQIKFLKTDIFIQKSLFLLVFISALPIFTLSMTMPLLGAWQLFSGLATKGWFDDKKREKYLRNSFVLLGLMFGSYYFADYFEGSGIFIFALFLMFVIIPMCTALWYYIVTKHSLEDLQKQNIVDVPESMNEILDSEEIFKIPLDEKL
ncbi:MAG: hypothetical protein AB8F94_23485 [Saprospiraceae bacterium]